MSEAIPNIVAISSSVVCGRLLDRNEQRQSVIIDNQSDAVLLIAFDDYKTDASNQRLLQVSIRLRPDDPPYKLVTGEIPYFGEIAYQWESGILPNVGKGWVTEFSEV